MNNPPPSWQTNQNPANPPVEQAPGQQMVQVQNPAIRPVVTYGIIGVTILVFLFQELLSQGAAGTVNDPLIRLGAMIPPAIIAGQVWRLLTPALLHFSLIHIGTNMYSLYVLGPGLERYYGHGRFLALYVLCAFGGNLLSFYMSSQNVAAAGASTAIFGLIAAEGIFIYQNRALFGKRTRGMLNNIIFLIVLNLVIGYSLQFDNWGHLGGLLIGAIFGWFAGPQMTVEPSVTGYRLVDQRSPGMTWLIAIVLAIFLSGLAFLRIVRG